MNNMTESLMTGYKITSLSICCHLLICMADFFFVTLSKYLTNYFATLTLILSSSVSSLMKVTVLLESLLIQ